MIIDTHTHFYDPLRPQGVPWPSEDNELLYRTVLPEHHREVSTSEGVTGTVVVEASSWLEDNQWVLDLAVNESWIVGFVGHVEPGREGFAADIERFAGNPLFRGIRLGGGFLEGIEQGSLLDDMEVLVKNDLELDLLMNIDHWDGLCFLAERIGELRIVVNHLASVEIDGNQPDSKWVDCMHRVSDFTQVYMKVSGLVEMAHVQPAPTDLGYYLPTLDVLWESYGEDRLIYGSNWPVSDIGGNYSTVINLVRQYFNGKGELAASKYWWQNAKAAYKWLDR